MTVTEKNQLFLKIIFSDFQSLPSLPNFLGDQGQVSQGVQHGAQHGDCSGGGHPARGGPLDERHRGTLHLAHPPQGPPGRRSKGKRGKRPLPPSFHTTQSTRVPGLRRDWPLARDLRGGSLTPKRLPLCLLPFFGLKPRRAFLRCQRSRHGLELTLCTTQTCCTSRRSFF